MSFTRAPHGVSMLPPLWQEMRCRLSLGACLLTMRDEADMYSYVEYAGRTAAWNIHAGRRRLRGGTPSDRLGLTTGGLQGASAEGGRRGNIGFDLLYCRHG